MGCSITDVPSLSELSCIFKVIVGNLLTVGGIIFFFMLLVGGFQFLTSGGNPESVARAQRTLTYAVMGLVAAVFAYTILLLIEYVTGAKVTSFKFQVF